MKAVLQGTVLADAPDTDVVSIEGNWYFPPSSLTAGALSESPTPYTCPWKGEAQYYDATTEQGVQSDTAWAYPTPPASAVERVGRDFAGYVAFAKSVEVA